MSINIVNVCYLNNILYINYLRLWFIFIPIQIIKIIQIRFYNITNYIIIIIYNVIYNLLKHIVMYYLNYVLHIIIN